MGVIPKPGRLDSDFLHLLLVNKPLTEFANDAGLPSIRKTTVENWRIRVPRTIGDQRRLAEKLNRLAKETGRLIDVYTRKLAALAELKQSLLARAFAGELIHAGDLAA